MITPLDILSLESWILVGTILILCRWYIHKQWRVLKDLQIPHDPPSILQLGNMRDVSSPSKFFTYDFEQRKKHGPIYGTYNGLTPRITIGDPDVIKQIMIKEASTFQDRMRTFNKLNGKEMNTALTAASGEQWKRIRHSLTPAFSTSKMKGMFAIIQQCTDKMVKNLEKSAKENGGRFETKDVFGKLSMDAICSSAFGVTVNSQEGDSELVQKSKKVFSQNLFGIFALVFMMFPWTEKIAEKLNYHFMDKELLSYYKRLIDTVIKNKKETNSTRVDILQGMLTAEVDEHELTETNKGITRTEIVGNSMIMLMAGYETTATTLSILAYCIANESEVQETLYKEILHTNEKYQDYVKNGGRRGWLSFCWKRYLIDWPLIKVDEDGDLGRGEVEVITRCYYEKGSITYEAVNSMKYLDMCLKESQRLYVIAPRNSRYTDVEITVKGITIPAGTHVDIPVQALHHDEEYWDEPWKFIPERFEDMSKIDPIIYQPFGAGPRICIGLRFAILEIKMAICKLLLNFELSTCEDTPIPPLEMTFTASAQPKADIFLKVKQRRIEAP